MENQNNLENSVAPLDKIDAAEKFKNEIQDISIQKLHGVMNKLKFICHEVDPYDAHDISSESKLILDEFGLNDYLENPFSFTNILLKIMDFAEAELNKRLH